MLQFRGLSDLERGQGKGHIAAEPLGEDDGSAQTG
jgi:hypothetical protein